MYQCAFVQIKHSYEECTIIYTFFHTGLSKEMGVPNNGLFHGKAESINDD